jgi:cytosine/adenosine deaminase-related metal-dependent hydrolase
MGLDKLGILIINGLIITVDKEKRVIEKGAIYTEGDGIKDIGKTAALRKKYPSPEETIDARGQIVMPGFFTSHSHLYGVLLRSIPPEKLPETVVPITTDFTQILHSLYWPVDERITYDFIYASALAAAIEFAKSGVTCLSDTLSAPNAIEKSLDYQDKALNEVGIKAVTAFEPTERRSKKECERGVQENVRFIKKAAKQRYRKVRGMMCLHASFTVTDETLMEVRELASKYKVPIHMHTHEGLNDIYHNYEHYGKRPIERLRDVGFLGPDVCLSHCIQCVDSDIKIIKETGATVAHDPFPNMVLGEGFAPVPEMLKEGITVGLGDDGFVLDPFLNMKVFLSAHAGYRRVPFIFYADQALEMYTAGASKCFGMEKEVGSLEIGKKADIILVKPPTCVVPLSASNVVDYVVTYTNGNDVQTTIVDGRVVMKDRELLTVDEEKAYEICQKEAAKLWDRIASAKPAVEFLELQASS